MNAVHGELTPEQRANAANIVAAAGLSRVTWTGGEPTLCPDLPYLVRHLQKAHVKNTITTHGLKLDKDLLDTIRDTADCLRVSFDGLEDVHNRIRGANAFNRSFSNIQKAIQTGIRVEVNLSAMRANVADLPPLATKLAEVGVSNVVVIALMLRESAIDNNLIQLDVVELNQLKLDLREALAPFPNVGLRMNDYQQVNDRYIILESDGTIVMSSDTEGDRSMGSILAANGHEILEQAIQEHTLEHQNHIVSPTLASI